MVGVGLPRTHFGSQTQWATDLEKGKLMTQESTQQATALDAAATTAVNPFIVVPPPAPVKPAGRFRRACDRMHGRGVILAERGMATAEYAVGILAAVALAIALLNIFQNNEFLTKMLKFVVDLIGKAGDMIK